MIGLDRPTAENDAESPPAAFGLRPWFLVAVLILGGLLLFAHLGCHGDEDTELFDIVRSSIP